MRELHHALLAVVVCATLTVAGCATTPSNDAAATASMPASGTPAGSRDTGPPPTPNPNATVDASYGPDACETAKTAYAKALSTEKGSFTAPVLVPLLEDVTARCDSDIDLWLSKLANVYAPDMSPSASR